MRERHPSFCGGTGEQVHAQLEQLIASTSLQAGADDSSARSLAELREMWRTSAQLRKEQLELAKALLDQAKASAAQHDKLLDAAMSRASLCAPLRCQELTHGCSVALALALMILQDCCSSCSLVARVTSAS